MAKDCKLPGPVCFRCYKPGHQSKDCPTNPQRGRGGSQPSARHLWAHEEDGHYMFGQMLEGDDCQNPFGEPDFLGVVTENFLQQANQSAHPAMTKFDP